MIIFPAGVGSFSNLSRDKFLDKHSVNFDGTNDYILVNNDASLTFGDGSNDSPFSISAWIKADDFSNFRIVTKNEWNSSTNYREFIFNAGDGYALLGLIDAEGSSNAYQNYRYRGSSSSGSLQMSTGVWYHVVGTYDGTGGTNAHQGIKLYVNGVLETNYTDYTSGTYVAMHNNTGSNGDIAIGAWKNNTFANGKITQVGIWNRVLSSEEIQLIYDRPNNLGLNSNYKSYSSSGLVGYWPMLKGSGDTITDASLNSNNGTLTNGPTWSYATASKSILEPKYSINFDGTNDHLVTAFNTNAHNLRNGFTISAWVYLDDNSTTQDFFGRYGSSTARFYFGITGSKVRAAIGTSYDTSSLSHGMSTGKWHHVAYTFSGGSSGTFTFYLDGSSVGTITFTWTGDSGSNENVHIGGLNNGGNDYQNPFNGKMTDLAFFSSTASATEISTIYNNGNLLDLSVDSGDYEFSGNLVAYWRMNEGTGTSAKDIIGVKNGTLTNSPTWDKSMPFKPDNSSVYFDGSNDYADLGSPFQSTFRAAHTIAFWIKVVDGIPGTAYTPNLFGVSESSNHRIFAIVGNASGSDDGKISFYYKDGSTQVQTRTDSAFFSDGENNWVHVAFTVTQATNGVKIYKNGVQIDTTEASGSMNNVTMSNITLTDNFLVGARNNNGSSNYWYNCYINQFAIWNEALTSSEIVSIYNDGVPINVASNLQNYASASNLVGYWAMNEASGNSLTDSSSNSSTGTLTNGPTWSNDSWNTLTKQTRNYSLDFDGTNDYVPLVGSLSAGTYNFFTSTLKYSVSIWFQLDDHTADATQVLLANNYTASNKGIQVWYDNRDGYATKAIRVNSWAGSSVSTNTASAISDNNWHHLVVTSSGASETLAVYLDGALLAIASLGSVTSTAPNQDLAIGGRVISSSVDSPINGKMKDVAIFNRALSEDAVKSIYNDGEVIDLTKDYGHYKRKNNLIAYYQMEEGEGTILMDRTGNGRNGTLTNGPTYSTSTP